MNTTPDPFDSFLSGLLKTISGYLETFLTTLLTGLLGSILPH